MRSVYTTACIAVMLTSAACATVDGASPTYEPRRVVVADGVTLPDDLQAATNPDVRMLLRIESEEDINRMESLMAHRGFRLIARFPAEGDGLARLRFFGGVVEVLHTMSADVCWIASEAMWREGLPFGWAMSQGESMFVPSAYAVRAREVLSKDDRSRGRVIDANGDLLQDTTARRAADTRGR